MPPVFSKITLLRLWLSIALLGSVLTFSGQTRQTTFLPVSGTLTELAVPEYGAGKKVISYQRAVSLTLKNVLVSFCFYQPQPVQTVFRHNLLGLIKLKSISRLYLQLKAQNNFKFLNFIHSFPENKAFARLA